MSAPTLDRARRGVVAARRAGRLDHVKYSRAVRILGWLDEAPATLPGRCAGCGVDMPRSGGRGRPRLACDACAGIVRRVRDAEKHQRARHVEKIGDALDDQSSPAMIRRLYEDPDVGGSLRLRERPHARMQLADQFEWSVDDQGRQRPLKGHNKPGGPWVGTTVKRGTFLYGRIYGSQGIRQRAAEHPWWAGVAGQTFFRDAESPYPLEGPAVDAGRLPGAA